MRRGFARLSIRQSGFLLSALLCVFSMGLTSCGDGGATGGNEPSSTITMRVFARPMDNVSQVIANALVEFRSILNNSLNASGYTNAQGYVDLNVKPGNYNLVVRDETQQGVIGNYFDLEDTVDATLPSTRDAFLMANYPLSLGLASQYGNILVLARDIVGLPLLGRHDAGQNTLVYDVWIQDAPSLYQATNQTPFDAQNRQWIREVLDQEMADQGMMIHVVANELDFSAGQLGVNIYCANSYGTDEGLVLGRFTPDMLYSLSSNIYCQPSPNFIRNWFQRERARSNENIDGVGVGRLSGQSYSPELNAWIPTLSLVPKTPEETFIAKSVFQRTSTGNFKPFDAFYFRNKLKEE
ncbi:MAG TPA: hypothetical protein VN450_07290 [Candidatus Methylomirabilis sp.]|nr:hypothetical protein [Candidatus Methylomirabilis sp.]